MARDDDLGTRPVDPYPRSPHEDVWVPDPDAQDRAAALATWLEGRFPAAGTLQDRTRRERRRTWLVVGLGGAALLAFVVVLVVAGRPEPQHPASPWRLAAVLGFALLWAALTGGVAAVARHRPHVSPAERQVVARLTPDERRELRADVRSPHAPDAGQLDAVAAAWLAGGWSVAAAPSRVLPPLVWLTLWELGWWSLPAAALVVVGLVDVAAGVRDLAAARRRLGSRGPAPAGR